MSVPGSSDTPGKSLFTALSDRACDAAAPLLFAADSSDVGRLVEAALTCASALLKAEESLTYIVKHPGGVGDHRPEVVAAAALRGQEAPHV